MAEEVVRYELRDSVAHVRLDDGKVNALSPTVLDALNGALDRAEKEAGALLLVGRPGRFSGGFDLSVLRSSPEAMIGLVRGGGELFARFLEFPLPIVAACTGHAIAAGALTLLSSDTRFGARGDFKLGLNEVAIGMTLPVFAVELARLRLSKRHFTRSTTQGTLYAPDEAVDAGYLDVATAPDSLEEEAFAEAARLAGLPRGAFAATKERIVGPVAARIRESLAEEFRAGP